MRKSFKTHCFPRKKYIFLLTLCILFGLPDNAYAYLDPGSGSALFTGIIAIALSGLHFFKMIYYRLVGKMDSQGTLSEDSIVLFSEGKNYWGTFEALVNELIKNKIHFRYISLDVFDPGLEIDNEYMHSKLYSKTNAGFAKISTIKAPIMLATTPNIGSKDYPLPRPKNVKELIHVFHDFVAGANYSLGGLDYYDSIITTGEYAEKYIRRSEEVRGLKAKEIIPLGLPYLDILEKKLKNEISNSPKQNISAKTVLIAPSWGSKGCFNFFGIDFVKELLTKSEYKIIIRLHPHSYIYEQENVEYWKNQLSHTERVVWDEELYSTDSMQKADILISDTSSVRFDFAFLHLKPVITLFIPQEKRLEFEAYYHEVTWDVEVAPKLGALIEKENIHNIPTIIQNVLSTHDSGVLTEIRDSNIINFGKSAQYIVPFLQHKVQQLNKVQ